MRPLALSAAGISVLLLAGVLAWASPAVARAEEEATELRVSAPIEAAVGETAQVVATLSSGAGEPVSGAQIVVVERVGFLDTSAEDVTVASAATNADGVAAIHSVARREGARSLLVRFPGSAELAEASIAIELIVAGGDATYTVEAPPGIPGVSRFMVMAVLVAVWGTMFVVAFHVVAIAREGSRSEGEA